MAANYKVKAMTPMLETLDLAATVAFYEQILGFTCNEYHEAWGWTLLSKDSTEIMFSLPNAHRNIKEPIMSGSLYLRTDEVEQVWNDIKDHCKISYPMEDFEYGMREFGIFDNNGYLLQFGKEIAA